MMNSLIVGYGEIGSALYNILKEFYNIGWMDVTKKGNVLSCNIPKKVEILHICFGYSDKFEQYVKDYQKKYKPKYTVVHSTIPVGTSRRLNAISSPVRGRHPQLEEGIRTFVKFLGGEKASEVADYFRKAGIKVILLDSSEAAEALKLFDTEYFKICIEFAKRVKKYCYKYNLNFHEVYTLSNQSYNLGYTQLGFPEFSRPVLQPIMQEIGGHCILPNSGLLKLSE